MAKTVLAGFDELVTKIGLTDDQVRTASTRHTNLRDFLERRFTLLERPALVGSYSRQTIIRQDKDIDIMACFSHEKYWPTYEKNSSGLVYLLRKALNDEYGSSDVTTSGAAVVMSMTIFNVDVVPVFKRNGGGYILADGKGSWKSTNPDYHFDLMERRNTEDPRLKRLVKIMKFWSIRNGTALESFHLEMMIENMWRGVQIGSLPNGCKETLRCLPPKIQKAFNDPWEPGGRIDGYLSPDGRDKAFWRATTDASSAGIAEQLRLAGQDKGAFDQWQKVFINEFPAYG